MAIKDIWDEPLRRYVSHMEPQWPSKNRTYDIAGQSMNVHEIEAVFGISRAHLTTRIRYGMSPTDAATTPLGRPVSVETAMLSGWRYWCAERGIPETDSDILIEHIDLPKADRFGPVHELFGRWMVRTNPTIPETSRSGIMSLGISVATHHADPQKLVMLWTDAVVRERQLLIELPRHRGHYIVRSVLRADARARWFLPGEGVWKASLLGSAIMPYIGERREGGAWDLVKDMFGLLGFVTLLRKASREHCVLLHTSAGEAYWKESDEKYVAWWEKEMGRRGIARESA